MYVKPNKLVVVASVWELETLLVTLEKVDMTCGDPLWVLVCDELIAFRRTEWTILCKYGLNLVW